MSFKDHAVVITGAGGGIGRAIALAFAAEGAGLVLNDLADSLEGVADEARRAGGRAVAQRGDVTRPADMAALAERCVREFGGLHVLVTCAGLGSAGLLVEQDEGAWTRVVDVNLNGTYRAIRAALPPMMAQTRGRIITIASVLGRMGGYGFVTAYAASKHGVIGLTRAAALDYAAQNIRINAVCPGYIDTPMMGRFTGGTSEGRAQVISEEPIGRMGRPEEIANAVLWLCSDAA